ncbi:hypothetical protein [Moorena producens]|uniref:hypothetical protein n=1 Tax=Moorena producens TaxID=1155739 RepID=UPI003C737F1A
MPVTKSLNSISNYNQFKYPNNQILFRFPIPDSRFPIPDSRFPVPCSLFPVP